MILLSCTVRRKALTATDARRAGVLRATHPPPFPLPTRRSSPLWGAHNAAAAFLAYRALWSAAARRCGRPREAVLGRACVRPRCVVASRSLCLPPCRACAVCACVHCRPAGQMTTTTERPLWPARPADTLLLFSPRK